MVKVGSMTRAKRYVVIAGILLAGAGTADAGLFGSRKASKTAAEAAPASVMTLSAVEIDGSRVILRTSGAPAYTSYSPAPGVFVVDLTGTSRDAAVSIPSTLPPAVASIAAEEVVEMGNRLTRVTFRLSSPMNLEVAALDKAVAVTVPATAIPIETVAAAVEVLPTVVPAIVDETPEPVAEPIAEPIAETIAATAPAPVVTEPATTQPVAPAVKEPASLPRARTLRGIAARAAGDAVEVRLTADGALRYKAFRLDNPTRLVIDLDGVKNGVAKSAVTVDDDVVKRVRVAQFQPTVARVVIDLTRKAEYSIDINGDELLIAFGDTAAMPAIVTRQPVSAPQPVKSAPVASKPAETQISVFETAPKPAPVSAPVKQQPAPPPADIPAQVPTIAESAPVWKMPEPASKGARSVINPPQEVAPPTGTAQQEDVFAQPAQPQVTGAPQTISTRQLSGGRRVFNGEPISMTLKEADLQDVLATFAEITGLNMAIDPGVRGAVTVDFVDVPWDQALDIILRQNSLTYIIEGNVMRIGTVERIAAETAATRRLEEEERLNVPLTTLSFPINYARAADVAALLRDLASPRARILVDARTNQIIISEIPQYLQTMQNLITTVDVPTRQVTIEARIVESSRTFAQQWGFDWGFEGALDPALGTGTGLVFPNRVGFTGGPFEFGAGRNIISLQLTDVLGSFDLDFALSAAETQGFIRVVSAPRVTTQDNQAAQITSGFQIPYQTRINFTTTVNYLDATLSLAVTPQITDAGTVIMDISVQKNEPAPGLSIVGAAGTPLTTRQARTRLMVRDGGTAVIAGIFQTRDNNAQTRVPFVHNIPIIGALFRNHDISTGHDELLIFITPRIVRG